MSHTSSYERTALGALGAAIGKGLIAGFAGTVAITISQTIEMKIRNRKSSNNPAKAVERIFDIGPEPGHENSFSQRVHYAYGTLWGTARGLLSVVGITGFAATAVHFAALWGTAVTTETELGLAPPLDEWTTKDIVIDIFHHAAYVTAVWMVYKAID